MRFRVDGEALYFANDLPGQRIEDRKILDFAVEEFNTQGLTLALGRMHIDDLAAHAEIATAQLVVTTRVLQFGEPAHDFAIGNAIAAHHVQDHVEVFIGVTETVDCRNGRHDDRVATFQQRFGRRQAHLLDVLVDAGVFFNVGIARRHIGLGLVVVIVGNKVLDRVVREKFLELAVELRGESLVGREHQGWSLNLLDHISNRISLAAAGHAEQNLLREAGIETLN